MPMPSLADTSGASDASMPIISSISSFVSSGRELARSILFRHGKISRSSSRARYTLAMVCASTPWVESTTSTAPSQAARLLDTS